MNDMSKIGGHAISVHKYKTLLEDKVITQRNIKAYSVYTISFAKVLQFSEMCKLLFIFNREKNVYHKSQNKDKIKRRGKFGTMSVKLLGKYRMVMKW